MDNRERAKKILGIVRNPETISQNQIDMATAQLDEACAEARETTHCKVRCHCFAYNQAYAEGFRAGTESHGVEGHMTCTKCVADGFNAAREKAKGIAETCKGVSDIGMIPLNKRIADRIAKLEPSANDGMEPEK